MSETAPDGLAPDDALERLLRLGVPQDLLRLILEELRQADEGAARHVGRGSKGSRVEPEFKTRLANLGALMGKLESELECFLETPGLPTQFLELRQLWLAIMKGQLVVQLLRESRSPMRWLAIARLIAVVELAVELRGRAGVPDRKTEQGETRVNPEARVRRRSPHLDRELVELVCEITSVEWTYDSFGKWRRRHSRLIEFAKKSLTREAMWALRLAIPMM